MTGVSNARGRVARLALAAGIAAAYVMTVACRATPEGGPARTLRLAMGGPTTPPHQLGEVLIRSNLAPLANIKLEALSGLGAVDNIYAIQRGAADIGFTFADIAYFAFAGQLGPDRPQTDRIRGIANLQLTPLHIVVGARSAIRNVADLQGRRVGIGGPGSGTSVTARIVLRAFGVSAFRAEPTITDAPSRLMDGTLDAFFIVGSTSIVRKLTDEGARVLPVTGTPIERIQRDYPFLRPMVIPAGVSAAGALPTIGLDSLIVCRSDLPEDVVYNFTKALFEAIPAFSSTLEVLRFMDAEEAPATYVPLHQGASRFYREREMLR
jgi:TRAP transporter TAXI family solute receptor